MRTRRLLVAVVAVIAVAAAGCGSSPNDKTAAPSRTIDIDMIDIAFSPNSVIVPVGEPVRFVFHNRGKTAHDAFIGGEAAQTKHESEMGSSMGGMHGDRGSAITVEAGKTGSLTHTFAAGDQLLIGCHQPGHYAAGMQLTLATS